MRYLGNKTRLLKNIEKLILDEEIKGNVFCDLFSGTGSVGDYFKDRYEIISNDFLASANILAKGKLWNNKKPAFKKFISVYKKDPFDYFNNKNYEYKNHYLVTNYYSPRGERQFLSEKNSIKIDGIRLEIEEIYKEEIFDEKEYSYLIASLVESVTKFSNITGTYEAFLKNWDCRALKDFIFNKIDMNSVDKIYSNKVYNEDSNSIIRKIEGNILYIDPPYTITEYSTAYHVLETLVKYDYPEISGKTGRRVINNEKSNYTRKQEALYSFEDLIRQANFDNIIISYSNQSIIPLEELEAMLRKYAINNKIKKIKIPYREYKNIRSSKKGNELFEILIYLKKDNTIIKSPVNYSGSKDKLMNQITKYLPSYISNFVDCMGGAFNVGCNVVADKVIYNEVNPYVYNMIKDITLMNKNELVKYVEKQIESFKLKKVQKENYLKFREYYNIKQNTLDLFVLTMFCFQNQIRFNNSKVFNTPIGNCGYNELLRERILKFKTKTSKIEFENQNFVNIDYKKYDKNTMFYFDPPYFITKATYNDGKRGFGGWNSNLETELLEFLSELNQNNYKFMLSNVIYHKDKINHILLEWAKTNNFKIIELNHSTRKEIIIINYELGKGRR